MKTKPMDDSPTLREYLNKSPEKKSDYEISGLYNNGVQLLNKCLEPPTLIIL